MEIINPSEIISKRFNDARNIIKNSFKSKDNWAAFYGMAGIAKSYLRSDMGIHLHLILTGKNLSHNVQDCDTFRGKRESDSNLCIWFQRYPSFNDYFPRQTCKLPTSHISSQNRDEAMFIGLIQLLKKKKGIALTAIPSLVWLKSLNTCPITPTDTLKKSQSEIIMPESEVSLPVDSNIFEVIDRKSGIGRRYGDIGIPKGKLPDKTIQSRTEVMGNLPNDNTPFNGEGSRTIINADIIISSLFVELGSSR
ncbi:hypothetical protein ACFLUZ_01700 [Chloroflexota bacterium]